MKSGGVMAPPHEKLDVYQKAITALVLLDRVAQALPPGRSDLRDQLRRASTSVVLNLAGGAAEIKGPEKIRFYRMSRRSAAECLAVLDIVRALTPRSLGPNDARPVVDDVMAITTRMIQSWDRHRGKAAATPGPRPPSDSSSASRSVTGA